MTLKELEWTLYVKFSPLRTALFKLIFTYIPLSLVISRDRRRCAEADRDPQNSWDPRKDCGSFVDATSSEP